MKAQKIINIVATILFIAVCIWGIASWAEVMKHQSNTEFIYSAWNLFKLIF